MCLTNHAIVAAAAASAIHALMPAWTITHHVVAVIIAVCSHGVLDRIRHRDPEVNFPRLKTLVTNLMRARRFRRMRLWWFQPFWRFGRRDREARRAFTVLGVEVLGILGFGIGLPYCISRTPFVLTLTCVAVGIAPDVLEWVSNGISHRWAGPLVRRVQRLHECCHVDLRASPVSPAANAAIQLSTGILGVGTLYLLG